VVKKNTILFQITREKAVCLMVNGDQPPEKRPPRTKKEKVVSSPKEGALKGKKGEEDLCIQKKSD